MSDRYTPHFLRSEMEVTSKGLANKADAESAVSLLVLCSAVLEPFRLRVGPLQVTSAFRSPAVNAAVGGSSTSQHMIGEAADVIPTAIDRLLALVELRRMAGWGLPVDQAIVYENAPHLHISHTTSRANRCEFLVCVGLKKYVPWDSYMGVLRVQLKKLEGM